MLSTEIIGKRETLYEVEIVQIVGLGRNQYLQVFHTFLLCHTTGEEHHALLWHVEAATADEIIICIVPIVQRIVNGLGTLILIPGGTIAIVVDNLPSVRVAVCPAQEVSVEWSIQGYVGVCPLGGEWNR